MLDHIFSAWFWFGSNRPGFFFGSTCLLSSIILVWFCGIQANLTLGPGGEFPGIRDLFLYAFSHEELPSLLYNTVLLLLLGPCQERRWGTFSFIALTLLSVLLLPLLYTLILFIGGADASRICGFSAVQLALFTAQCRQVSQRRLLRCIPVWFLPWLLLLLGLALLPSTPALLHFTAILIGHNYRQSFIGMLQDVEAVGWTNLLPAWAYIPSSSRLRLPTFSAAHRPPMEDPPLLSSQPWSGSGSGSGPAPPWLLDRLAAVSEEQQVEDQMLRAGILASLQDTLGPDHPAPHAKVEVPKSSVSSIRLQQLEKMGFPTEKAVVALAASKQLDGAISLLIDDQVGEEAVVTSKGRGLLQPRST